jgi:hypothetical protein
MKTDKKIFISGGCSFSQVPNADKTWPAHVAESLEFEKTVHTGIGAAGNTVISRLIIYAVLDALDQGYDPSDVLVGIMWSGRNRMDAYSTNPNFPHTSIPVTDHEHKNYQNPTWLRDQNRYQYLINVNWEDPTSVMYFEHFYDSVGGMLLTLESVLKTQWFLRAKGIDYFMLEYSHDCIREGTDDLIAMPDLAPMYAEIDFSKWPCDTNMSQWVEYKQIPFSRPNDDHPSSDAHRQFVDEFVLPYIMRSMRYFNSTGYHNG